MRFFLFEVVFLGKGLGKDEGGFERKKWGDKKCLKQQILKMGAAPLEEEGFPFYNLKSKGSGVPPRNKSYENIYACHSV